jgi:hypothetical protein
MASRVILSDHSDLAQIEVICVVPSNWFSQYQQHFGHAMKEVQPVADSSMHEVNSLANCSPKLFPAAAFNPAIN